MGLFKPNVEKLKKKSDFAGLLKILKSNDASMHIDAIDAIVEINGREKKAALLESLKHENTLVRNKAAIALRGYKSAQVVNALIQAAGNTDEALRSIMKMDKTDAIDPLVVYIKTLDYWNKSKLYFGLVREFSLKNKIVKGITKGLEFPEQYNASKTFYEGKSINEALKKLSAAADWIPGLPQEQILQEYECLKNRSGLFAFNPGGLHGGLVSDVKKAIKEQLSADVNWLSAPKVSFQLISGGWNAAITTFYIRPPANLSYWTNIWRSTRDDGKAMYYYCFSERNW